MDVKANSIYRHYKGNFYKVVGIAKDADSLEQIVVYKNIESPQLWTRSLSNFTEILGDSKEGTHCYRFTSVSVSCVAWECLTQAMNWNCNIQITTDELLQELGTHIRAIAKTVHNTCIQFEILKKVKVKIRPASDYKNLSAAEFYSVDQWFEAVSEVGFSGHITVRIEAQEKA